MIKQLFVVVLLFTATNLAGAADASAIRTVTLKVEKMSCAACPITVRKALERVPGVTGVKVDYDTKTATVTFDPGQTKVETLTQATTDAGYPSAPAN